MTRIEPPPLAVSHPALRMVDAFASVGVTLFDISFTDAHEEPTGFRRGQTPNQVRGSLRHFIARGEDRDQPRNVIIRPSLPKERGVLIQLDDVRDQAMQTRLAPLAFLTVETSPGNRQLWVAVTDPEADTRRRMKKAAGADAHASGAVRLAGTRNLKPKYAPSYPVVELAAAQPGKTVTRREIDAAGLLPKIEHAPSPPWVSRRPGQPQRWPSYEMTLRGAPRGGDDGEQRYAADFTWAMTAIDWGWSPHETAARLMQESTKAKENGEDYARMTAKNAAEAVERRSRDEQQRRQQRPRIPGPR